MRSNERVFAFIEDLQSNDVCLWNVHCADYKIINKKDDAVDFIAKYEVSTTEVEISPLAKYWSVKANMIRGVGGGCFAKFCVLLLSSVADFLD
jgi:hypothetical protein